MYSLTIKNMTCNNCVQKIEKTLYTAEPEIELEFDLANKTLDIIGAQKLSDYLECLKGIGFHAHSTT